MVRLFSAMMHAACSNTWQTRLI